MIKRVHSLEDLVPRGTSVRVYRNLHLKCLSVQALTYRGWRVVAHADEVRLRNPVYKVSQAGRERVLKQRRKNVHAYIEGTVADRGDLARVNGRSNSKSKLVLYNPYVSNQFLVGTTNCAGEREVIEPHVVIERGEFAQIRITGVLHWD